MTYCKDCRTEFMVEADDPCPRCGRYLGGARMGQRAEVALPEQSAQPAAQKTLMDAVREHFGFAQPEPPVAQQAPVPPPAAPAPIVEPPRPAQQVQTLWDAIAQGFVSLFVRLVPLVLLVMLLGNMNLLPSELVWDVVVALAITMVVITILSKTSQRAAQTWRPAGESTASASLAQTTQPAAAQQLSASPSAALVPTVEPSRPPRSTQAIAEDIAVGCASVIVRLMLLAVLAIPAGIGFGLLVFYQGRHPAESLLWFLYVSVFAPIVCCVFMSIDVLDDLMRNHPWFCVIVLLWVFLATGLFLWGMSDPNTFRIFLSVFGGGYY